MVLEKIFLIGFRGED